MAQVLPLLILHSRKLSEDEKKNFHQFFNNVISIDKYTVEKKLTDFNGADTVLLCNLEKELCRDWLAINSKFYDANHPVVWVKNSGDKDEQETIKHKYECKRIPNQDFKDKLSFLNALYQSHVAPIVSKKKRFLKKLVSCCLSSVSN